MIETFGLWVAAFLTLCIYSFLYRDNPFYRFAEHLFVGISVGYGIVISIHQGVIPLAWVPLSEAVGALWTEIASAVFPGIAGEVTPETRQALWGLFKIIPIFIGLLFFARISPSYTWLIRYPIAILIGYGAGVAIPNVLQANIFAQTRGTVAPFVEMHSTDPALMGNIGAGLMIIGVLITISYFLFSVEQRSTFKLTVLVLVMVGMTIGIIGFGLIIADSITDDGLTQNEIVGAFLLIVGVLCSVFYLLFPAQQRGSYKWALLIIGIVLFIVGLVAIYGSTIVSGNLTAWDVFGSVLMVVGVICTLTYFFFSVEHTGPIKWTSKIGIAFLMIGFGAAFGNTVMGRLALMIHRVGFLINDWLGSIVALFG